MKKKKELVKSTRTNFDLAISRLEDKANPSKPMVAVYCVLTVLAIAMAQLALNTMEVNSKRFEKANSYYNVKAECECGYETLTATDYCTECGASSDTFTVVPNAYCSRCDVMCAPFEDRCPKCGAATKLATDTDSITIRELGYDNFADFKAREVTYIWDLLHTLGCVLASLVVISFPAMAVWDMIICKAKLETIQEIYNDLDPALKAIYVEDKKHKKEKEESLISEEVNSESEIKDGE